MNIPNNTKRTKGGIMKFNIGDQIRLNEKHDKITAVDLGKDGQTWYQIGSGRYTDSCFELVNAAECNHEYICKKCGEALGRLPEPTPTYAVGDKAKIIKNTSLHWFAIGAIVEITGRIGLSGCRAKSSNGYAWAVHYCDIEPYAEPTTIKLYCVEDDCGWLKKGKIYSSNENGRINFEDDYFLDNGERGYISAEHFFSVQNQLRRYLVPLVNRPAKVGEWVYIESSGNGTYKHGDVLQVLSEHKENSGVYVRTATNGMNMCDNAIMPVSQPFAYLYHSEYLVLDGYSLKEPAPKEMTVADVEKALGHAVKIVKEAE